MRKRILSLTLAMVMAMSMSVSVFASETVTEMDGASLTMEQLTGEGSVAYVNLEIVSVVLPTAAAYGFTIDPQGLAGIANGESSLVQDLTGGYIVGKAPVPIINNSSIPVQVEATFKVTGQATAVDDIADIDAEIGAAGVADNNGVLLYAGISTGNVLTANNFISSDKVVALTSTATKFNFVFPAATYAVRNNNGTYVTQRLTNSGHGNAIVLAGAINDEADWAAFEDGSKTIALTVDFKLTKLNDTTYATATTAPNGPSVAVPGYGHFMDTTDLTALTNAESGIDVAAYKGPSAVVTSGTATSGGVEGGIITSATGSVVVTASLGTAATAPAVNPLRATAVDQTASMVEMVMGNEYVAASIADLVAANVATFSPTTQALTLKKEFFALGLNNKTEVRVNFKFTGSDVAPMVSFKTLTTGMPKPAAQ